MKPREPRFLTIEGWKDSEKIAHGFGMRDPGGEKPSRKDWWGEAVQGEKEAFPLACLHQVQGDRVVSFEGEEHHLEEIWGQEGDALITRAPGFGLGVFTADCLPIFLYDPLQGAIGVVHAGWRGTAKGVTRKAVERMKAEFSCRSTDMLAALGPCIGPCCLEVDGPVKIAFSEGGIPWNLVSQPRGRDRWLLDLHQANIFLLETAGVPRANIQHLKICTSCRRDILYSYRNADKTGGRQLNFIALRKGAF
jgi:YfiH family protein